jgi:hypothetical protein
VAVVGADAHDDVLEPVVRMPNFAKIMQRVKHSGKKSRAAPVDAPEGKRRGKATGDWSEPARGERDGGKVSHKAATSAGAKRAAEGGVKRGKKASSKPAVRRRT